MGCIKLTIRSDGEQGSKLRHYLNSAFNHDSTHLRPHVVMVMLSLVVWRGENVPMSGR